LDIGTGTELVHRRIAVFDISAGTELIRRIRKMAEATAGLLWVADPRWPVSPFSIYHELLLLLSYFWLQ
jgi:hypothetical protein